MLSEALDNIADEVRAVASGLVLEVDGEGAALPSEEGVGVDVQADVEEVAGDVGFGVSRRR